MASIHIAGSWSEVEKLIRRYEHDTFSHFVVDHHDKSFWDEDIGHTDRIRWNLSAGVFGSIPFTGTPFIFIGKRVLICHRGRDKGQSAKRKWRELRQKLADEEDIHLPRKILKEPTKKTNCGLTIVIKKIMRFPQFEAASGREKDRKLSSVRLRYLLHRAVNAEWPRVPPKAIRHEVKMIGSKNKPAEPKQKAKPKKKLERECRMLKPEDLISIAPEAEFQVTMKADNDGTMCAVPVETVKDKPGESASVKTGVKRKRAPVTPQSGVENECDVVTIVPGLLEDEDPTGRVLHDQSAQIFDHPNISRNAPRKVINIIPQYEKSPVTPCSVVLESMDEDKMKVLKQSHVIQAAEVKASCSGCKISERQISKTKKDLVVPVYSATEDNKEGGTPSTSSTPNSGNPGRDQERNIVEEKSENANPSEDPTKPDAVLSSQPSDDSLPVVVKVESLASPGPSSSSQIFDNKLMGQKNPETESGANTPGVANDPSTAESRATHVASNPNLVDFTEDDGGDAQFLDLQKKIEFYVFLPDPNKHIDHEAGSVAGDDEPIDNSVREKVRELVKSGLVKIPEIMKKVREYVVNELFVGQPAPEISRRRYHPRKKDIKNILFKNKERIPHHLQTQLILEEGTEETEEVIYEITQSENGTMHIVCTDKDAKNVAAAMEYARTLTDPVTLENHPTTQATSYDLELPAQPVVQDPETMEAALNVTNQMTAYHDKLTSIFAQAAPSTPQVQAMAESIVACGGDNFVDLQGEQLQSFLQEVSNPPEVPQNPKVEAQQETLRGILDEIKSLTYSTTDIYRMRQYKKRLERLKGEMETVRNEIKQAELAEAGVEIQVETSEEAKHLTDEEQMLITAQQLINLKRPVVYPQQAAQYVALQPNKIPKLETTVVWDDTISGTEEEVVFAVVTE